MSSIYIQEPPTTGKVLLITSVGDIDVELWTRECPKACRNFIQLCMEGYYNGTIFHRVVKGFIAQSGDPNGDGTGGESIYGQPFRDEFHSRLRFTRRGLVAMANCDKDDNGSQFFFTLGPTPELQNKHTLFGKVTGDTVFNMLKLEDGLVDHNERPLYPHRIIKTEILNNPFEDIVPRKVVKEKKEEKPKEKEKGVKNFGLLSFGEEAEEDEFETTNFVKQTAGKGKSSHDVLDDPKLSKEAIKIQRQGSESPEPYHEEDDGVDPQEKAERIREKLKQAKQTKEKIEASKEQKADEDSDPEADFLQTVEKEKKAKREEKAKQIREEILSLKKQYKKDQKAKDEMIEKEIEKDLKMQSSNELVREYMDEKEKYAHRKEKIPKKGPSREEFTLSLLKKFKTKLESVREQSSDDAADTSKSTKDIEEDIKTDSWLSHKLQFEEQAPILAKDASTKSDDWYDVYDPRNPINKRKRGEGGRSDSKRNKT